MWTAACQASLSSTSSQSLLKFMSIESVMPSNHFILFLYVNPKTALITSMKLKRQFNLAPVLYGDSKVVQ